MGKRWLAVICICLLAVLAGAYREDAVQAGTWEEGL